MNRLFLLTGLLASSSAALAGPFVGLNMGLSGTSYRDIGNKSSARTDERQKRFMFGFSTGYTFSFDGFFVAPFGEIKAILGNDRSKITNHDTISGARTVFGGGLGFGYHFEGFSPYARVGFRTQRISRIERRQSVPIIGGTLTGNFKSSSYVTGLSWGLGADIPVYDALSVNINFTTTYQNQKAKHMAFADNRPTGAMSTTPKRPTMSTPFKRNVSDVTVGVRYAL